MSGKPAGGDVVLVIDDSPGSLGMVTDALDAAGLTVLVALDGKTALDILTHVTPDVILVDAIMPGMNGFETCRKIRARPLLAHIPIIFMTGLTETAHVVEGLEAGGVDYLTKPIVPDVLLARMRVHLANARSGQSARDALDVSGRHFLTVTSAGKIGWSTPEAGRLLAEAGVTGGTLPEHVRIWLRGATEGDVARHAQARTESTLDGLAIGFVGTLGNGDSLLSVSAAHADPSAQDLQARLGVTPREAEVLFWLMRGKSNRDISDILGVAPRTIDKHLEQIYPKLGVENRAAAAVLASRASRRNT